MRLRLPSFIIPGAGKSGTTYLSEIIKQHPEIYIPVFKEPAFFSTFKGRGFYHKGLPFYFKHFENYNGEKEIGEASTVYMYDPNSPNLIKNHLGDIKLIFMLRNPIDRIYSNYWQEIKAGNNLPFFYDFISSGNDRAEEMVYVSKYDIHLKRYLSLFDKNKIYIGYYEDIKNAPEKLINSVLGFLEVDPDRLPTIDFYKKVNPSSITKFKHISKFIRNRTFRQTIKQVLPSNLLSYANRISKKINYSLQQPFTYGPMDQKSRSYLKGRITPSIKSLQEILNKDLSHWIE